MEREYHVVVDALHDIGFSASEIGSIHAVVASVLMLGNLEFDDDSSGQAEVVNKEVCVCVCVCVCVWRKSHPDAVPCRCWQPLLTTWGWILQHSSKGLPLK
jgi:hypothetical protein